MPIEVGSLDRRLPRFWFLFIGVILLTGSLAALAAQEASPSNEDEVVALKAELEALRQNYEARLSNLEARLRALEATPLASPQPESAAAADDSLEALRQAARAAAGDTADTTVPQAAEPGEPTVGLAQTLNRLNPELSVTGDIRFVGTDGGDDNQSLDVREFEIDLQSSLDPFSKMRLTLAGDTEEIEIEEAYLVYPTLGGVSLTLGKFRQQFGSLNRQHLHALPQADYPLALRSLFGEEGLAQTGLSLRWLLPRPWAGANELVLEVTDNDNDFFGDGSDRFNVLGHLKNYWDLSDAIYFEWGLSGLWGESADGPARAWGTDLTLHWQPPARSLYRELTWRTEILLSERDDVLGATQETWGGYTSLEALVAQNLSLGLRLDSAEDPFELGRRSRALVPFVTWWQSEFVRLRAEVQYLEPDEGSSETRFLLQAVWAAGPHKHESY